ncbi:MAG: hypothetical protein ACLTSD_07900, partial [Eubacterium sp.]
FSTTILIKALLNQGLQPFFCFAAICAIVLYFLHHGKFISFVCFMMLHIVFSFHDSGVSNVRQKNVQGVRAAKYMWLLWKKGNSPCSFRSGSNHI